MIKNLKATGRQGRKKETPKETRAEIPTSTSPESKARTEKTKTKANPKTPNKVKIPETTEIKEIWGPSSLATYQVVYLPNQQKTTRTSQQMHQARTYLIS